MTSRGNGRPPESRGPKPLSEILGELFAARGLGRLQAQADLESAWSAAVGEPGRRQTKVESIRNGILTVIVAHPTLLEELRSYQKSSLLQALRRALPDEVLHDLRFRIGSLTTPQASPETPKPRPNRAQTGTKASETPSKAGRKPRKAGS